MRRITAQARVARKASTKTPRNGRKATASLLNEFCKAQIKEKHRQRLHCTISKKYTKTLNPKTRKTDRIFESPRQKRARDRPLFSSYQLHAKYQHINHVVRFTNCLADAHHRDFLQVRRLNRRLMRSPSVALLSSSSSSAVPRFNFGKEGDRIAPKSPFLLRGIRSLSPCVSFPEHKMCPSALKRFTHHHLSALTSLDTNSKVKSQTRSNTRGAKVQTKAFSDVNVTISAANALMLSLGRFAFMPYQRAQMEKAGLPEQNGETHFAAGDVKAEEASFLNTTNDPAGFTLIDVMAWGSLGHALGFAALAIGSFSLL